MVMDINVNMEQTPEIIGAEPATEEEEQMLKTVMDGVEQAIHGEFRSDVIDIINSHPTELWQSTGQLATMIVTRAAHQLDAQEIPYDSSIFFGENGAIQETVEMLWEVADALGHPMAEDEDQFVGAYFATLKNLGEMMFEDEESAKEAQDFMLEQEFGVDLVELAANELETEAIEEDPSLIDNLRDRGASFLDNLRRGIGIGGRRDPNAAPGRKAIQSGDTDVQLRDELDPNEALRRRMREAGLD